MQKKSYLCNRITKKKTALLCFGRRGAVGGKRKCIMFEKKTPKGGNHFYFSSAKVLLFFDIRKFSTIFLEKKLIFMYN